MDLVPSSPITGGGKAHDPRKKEKNKKESLKKGLWYYGALI
jgi:hypothetical protein